MDAALLITEWGATLAGLIFLILLMYEVHWCWLFGILSSLLSVYLFYQYKLYSETILYFLYVLFGIYGWWRWLQKNNNTPIQISSWRTSKHTAIIGTGIVLAGALGWLFKTYTDADKSYIDASTTVFGLIATYLEAHKILESWIYWVIINGVTIWLYFTKGMTVYVALMAVYFVLSFIGWHQWRWQYRQVSQRDVALRHNH